MKEKTAQGIEVIGSVYGKGYSLQVNDAVVVECCCDPQGTSVVYIGTHIDVDDHFFMGSRIQEEFVRISVYIQIRLASVGLATSQQDSCQQ